VDRDKALLCAAVVAAAAAGLLLSPLSPLARAAAGGPGVSGLEGVTWSPAKPAGHLAQGGLWHPPLCGQGRTGLIRYGWAWISQPPSEAQTGLGDDG
jgi:hypothetical protein